MESGAPPAPVPGPYHPVAHVADGLDGQLHYVEQVCGQGGTRERAAGR
jgi:hypothetical protein